MLEDDGRVDEKIFNEYTELGLRYPPTFTQVSTTEEAAEVLAYADKMIPEYNVPVDFNSGSLDQARLYIELGQKAKGMDILKKLWTKSEQYLTA